MISSHKAIVDTEHYCMKCQKNVTILKTIHIGELGYGSAFDGENTKIQLCEECYNESIKEIPDLWGLSVIKDPDWDYIESYKYEDKILAYIDSLPIESIELVKNRFANGSGACYTMDSQDWIDYQLDILPHEKCKEYGIYSKEEREAFVERFPKCSHVVRVVYSDDSSGCKCPFGAFSRSSNGDVDYHNVDETKKIVLNTCADCYLCKNYQVRVGDIKEIKSSEWLSYELYVKYHSCFDD